MDQSDNEEVNQDDIDLAPNGEINFSDDEMEDVPYLDSSISSDGSNEEDGGNQENDEPVNFNHGEDDAEEIFWRELAILVRKHCFSREAVNELLALLRINGHESLPKTRDTLCRAPRVKNTLRFCKPGNYYHFGVENCLQKCNFSFLSQLDVVTLDFNIDGLALAKSSKIKIWPIMGAFPNKLNVSPFVVGAYVGYADPACIDDFLFDFVNEMEQLLLNGVKVTPRKLLKPLVVRTYICDAPARAFLTGTFSHLSNVGCGKCNQKCVQILGKRAYRTVRAEPRTDETFRDRQHLDHHRPQFRNYRTSLEIIGTGMVSQVVYDPMHLIDRGVYARMLGSIMFGPCNYLHLRDTGKKELDKLYTSFKPYVPADFERKPRSIIEDYCRFKASEFRFGLLYAGVVLFKDIVGPVVYKHFLKLFVAVRLLSAPATHLIYSDFAQQLLDEFVAEYPAIYTSAEMVYNIHGAMHIVEDARRYGPLYSWSAYRYENHMREIRKLIKKPQQILQQLYRRYGEIESINELNRTQGFIGRERHFDNDIFPGLNTSYKGFQFDTFILQTNLQDSCCMLTSGIPVEIQEFSIFNGENVIIVKKFHNIRDFFTEIVSSMDVLGILLVDGVEEDVFMCKQIDVKYKFVRLPYKNCFVLEPILHHLISEE